MTSNSIRRHAAVMLIFATATALLMPPAMATPSANAGSSLTGRVLQLDGATPHSGVVVALFDEKSERTYRSEPTRTDGAFRIDEAPIGQYAILVETAGGAFLSPEPVALQAGGNSPVALRLQGSGTTNYQTKTGLGTAGLGTVTKWLIIGFIGVASLLVIDEVTEDEDESSAF